MNDITISNLVRKTCSYGYGQSWRRASTLHGQCIRPDTPRG